ncbi:hypothetical protein ACCO45_013683 [Purpureocillium lilacinum]|uniref:Uncharacterized protein n=1 Tax=Purpureocillium lilacinum TaxID=33203 RepID=A0ACC4D6X7_PURLI
MDADVNLNVANEVSGVLPALRDVMVLFVSLTLEVATLGIPVKVLRPDHQGPQRISRRSAHISILSKTHSPSRE